MGVIIRQSIKNSIISYAGIVLGFISTILLYPQILTAEQYGLTRLLFSVALVSAQFAHLGTNNIIIRFFPYFRESAESRGRFLSLALLISLGGFILFALFCWGFQGQLLRYYNDSSTLFAQYYFYLIPLVLGILFFEVLNHYISALQDSVTGSWVHDIFLRVLIILLLGAYYFQWIAFPTFMIGFIGSYCIQPIYLFVYLYRRDELKITFPEFNKRIGLVKEMSVYGAYSLLGGLATLLIGNIDIIMLGAMMDLSNTAVYAIAFYVGSVIAIPQNSILKIAVPILSGYLKDKKYADIRSLYQRTSINQIIAGSLLYIGIWANIHNLMVLLPAEYQGAKWVILTVGFAKLFNMATGINGGIILNSKYFRFDLYTNIFLMLFAVATNYILIPVYGILGAAVATALSIVLYNIIKLIFVWIKFSMQPFRWNAPVILALAAGCLVVSFQIPYLYNFVIDVIVRSLAITVIFIGSILLLNLSDDVQNLTSETLQRVKILIKS